MISAHLCHLRALSYIRQSAARPPARSLAVIDYSILSILSLVDIGRRARVLDVIVTSYPVSALSSPRELPLILQSHCIRSTVDQRTLLHQPMCISHIALIVCQTITFESLDVGRGSSYLHNTCGCISREYGSCSYMNVIGSRCSFAYGHALVKKAFLFCFNFTFLAESLYHNL